jgi:uncharacterized protein involved in cysteine biosynthesis
MRCSLCGKIISENICNTCNNSSYIKDSNKFHSIFYIFDGFKYIFSDIKIFKISFLPLIITAIISTIVFVLLMYLIFSYIGNYLADNNNIIYKIIFSLFGTLVASIIIIFSFIPLSTFVAIPFSEKLSLEIEKKLIGEITVENIPIIKSFVESLKILILKLLLFIIIFPINFIPVLGHITFLFISTIIAGLDFIDLPMSIKKYTLVEKINFISKNIVSYIFFCIPLLFLFWIPILQIFLIPASIIGATKFFINSQK